MAWRLLAGLLALGAVVSAQRSVDSRHTHSRVVCIVPMVGSGTHADPRRPQYAPWPPTRSRNGILAWSWQLTDDGKSAIVEFVALQRSAFAPIFNDKNVKYFEKGKAHKDTIQTELRKHKKDFNADKLWAVMP